MPFTPPSNKPFLSKTKDMLFLPLCLAAILPKLLPSNGVVDLFRHFTWLYFWLLCFGVIGYLIERQWKKAILLSIPLVLASQQLLPFYVPDHSAADAHKTVPIKVLQFNTWAKNRHPEAILKLIRNSRADIVGLEEINANNSRYLKQRLSNKDYPISIHNAAGHICLLSKFPLASRPVISQDPPKIISTFKINRKTIAVLLAHTGRPLGNPGYALEINTLIASARQLPEPLIVLGDLNTTPWSQYFQQLLTETRLKNTQAGQGIEPTYPSHIPKTQIYFPLPALPLDHILTSRDFKTAKRWNGPYSGSDHLPVLVDLQLGNSDSD